jgi:hypothetical protein
MDRQYNGQKKKDKLIAKYYTENLPLGITNPAKKHEVKVKLRCSGRVDNF